MPKRRRIRKPFLEGRRHDLIASLRQRMMQASEAQQYEQAGSYRDLLRTIEEIEERQKIAAAAGDDTDVLAWYAEPPQVAVNLFHLRGGRVVDRRDFYWEDLEEFDPDEFLPSLLKQLYLDAAYLPRAIHVPRDFEDRELLEQILSDRAATLGLPYRTRGNRCAATRPETRVPRSGGEKCAPFFRAALPRIEAKLEEPSPRRWLPLSICPSRPSASRASTYRTSKAPIPWLPWSSGKTAT